MVELIDLDRCSRHVHDRLQRSDDDILILGALPPRCRFGRHDANLMHAVGVTGIEDATGVAYGLRLEANGHQR
jgi:hypothetical protein